MKIISCQSFKEANERTRDTLKGLVKETGSVNIFLPTGRTPRGVYQLFREEKEFWAQRIVPLQIDEFVDPRRIFFEELKESILGPLGIEKRGHYIGAGWDDAEMKNHVKKVTDLGIDIAFLGLGPNGHVGFHEPGYHADFVGGRVTVSDETKNRVPGATTNETLTFGVGSFMKAKHVVLLALGSSKEMVFRKFLELDATPRLPASLLKKHPQFTVITDLK